MEFRELSVFEWEMIKPLLPPRSRVGRPRADDRMVLNGILYVLYYMVEVDGHACRIRLIQYCLRDGRIKEYGIGYLRYWLP